MTPPLDAHERKRFTEFMKEAFEAVRSEPMQIPTSDSFAQIQDRATSHAYTLLALSRVESKLTEHLNPNGDNQHD